MVYILTGTSHALKKLSPVKEFIKISRPGFYGSDRPKSDKRRSGKWEQELFRGPLLGKYPTPSSINSFYREALKVALNSTEISAEQCFSLC